MSKLPLSARAIFLETHRPQFLCEKLLDDTDEEEMAGNKTTAGPDAKAYGLNVSKISKQRSSASLLGKFCSSWISLMNLDKCNTISFLTFDAHACCTSSYSIK